MSLCTDLMKVQDMRLSENLISVAVEAGRRIFSKAGAPHEMDHNTTLCRNLGCSRGITTTARYCGSVECFKKKLRVAQRN